jgi:tetratricopeptide (TPR) repeat protein
MALAAAVAALLHGTFDVAGHRVGSALLALFILALARVEVSGTPGSRAVGFVWRAFGIAALAVAVLMGRMPGDTARAATLAHAGRYTDAEDAANRALARAPLDWAVYFTRAGERASRGRILEAVADFRRARMLEPHYVALPLEEGRFWVKTQPGLAWNAWHEAIRRAKPPEDESAYNIMLDASPNNAAFRAQMLALAHGRPPLQVQWFQAAPPAEAREHLDEIAAAAAQCSPAQRAAFERKAAGIGATPAASK